MENTLFISRAWNFLKKPAVSLALRVAVSGLLLAYLIKLSAFTEIARAFSRIDPLYLLAFFLLYLLSASVMSLRWKVLLKTWDVEQRFTMLFRRSRSIHPTASLWILAVARVRPCSWLPSVDSKK